MIRCRRRNIHRPSGRLRSESIDFAVAQEGNFYIKGEAGTGKSVVLAHIAAKFKHDNEQGKLL